MKYIIMCDGKGTRWKNYKDIPKHFVKINGEPLIKRTVRQLNEREQSGALQGDAGAFESNTLEGLTGTLAGGMTSGPSTAGNPSGPLTGPIGMVTPKTSGPLRQDMMPTQMQQNLMNQAMNQQPQKSGVNKGLLIATIAEGVIILVLLGLLLF